MEQLGQEDPKASQRLLWATLVLAVIFAAWAFFMRPTGPQPPAKPTSPSANAPANAPANVPANVPGKGPAAPGMAEALVPPGPSQAISASEAKSYTLKNGELSLEISNRGAVIRKAVLATYSEGGQKDDLVSPLAKLSGSWPLAIASGEKAFDELANGALFHVERTDGKDGARLEMAWSDEKGNGVRKTIGLPPKGYEITLEVTATMAGKPLSPVPLQWGPGFGKLLASQAKNRYYQQEYVGLYEAGAFKKVQRSKVKENNPVVTDAYGEKGPIAWAAISNNYFAAIFMPDAPMPSVKVVTQTLSEEQKKVHPADADIALVVAFPEKGRLFVGPKENSRLAAMGDSYFKLTDWGWLYPICLGLLWGMKKLFAFSRNYGVAIILLTFLIKLAFYPLTQRSMVKMKEMSEQMKKLKPQIDRIKAKYKKMGKGMEGRSKMNEEMMALYQREGINPLGQMSGCLPLLLQMPIFFALFQLLPRAIDLRGAAFFGWIQDLSVPDPFYVTPILMGVSMVVSTKMTSTQGLEGPQKMMLWFMPIMFTWFCLWAPAGLTLYWLTNNLLTMGQQAIINKQVAARQEAAARGKKSTPKGASKPS